MVIMRSSIRNNLLRTGNFPIFQEISFKWVTVLAVALLPFLTLYAQEKKKDGPRFNAREVFANLHTPGLETIRKSARLDLADYWEADSVHKVMTVSGGAAWLEALTGDYAKIHVSPVSDVELKILPYKKGKIVVCVYTVGDSVQAKDSEVSFYDESLRPLDKRKFFTPPVLAQFFDIPKGSDVTMEDIREKVPFPTVAYSLSAENTDITARLTVEDYISPGDLPTVRRFLVPELRREWKGKYKF